MLAANKGYKSIVDALIAKKAALDLQDKDDMTALMLAANKGYKSIVDALLHAGGKS